MVGFENPNLVSTHCVAQYSPKLLRYLPYFLVNQHHPRQLVHQLLFRNYHQHIQLDNFDHKYCLPLLHLSNFRCELQSTLVVQHTSGQSNCDRYIFHPSTKCFRRIFFSSPTFRLFDARLLLLSFYMLHPCHVIFFGERKNLSTVMLLTTAKDHSVAVINPWWAIIYNNFSALPS